jgi:Arc/MetJ-type ribon-helix-helix transcriptional regulator
VSVSLRDDRDYRGCNWERCVVRPSETFTVLNTTVSPVPTTQVDLPDRIDSEIQQLVERGEFLNREQAVEELLSMGISAYGPMEEETEEPGEDLFSNVDEQQDPAAMDNDEEYTL